MAQVSVLQSRAPGTEREGVPAARSGRQDCVAPGTLRDSARRIESASANGLGL